MSDGNALFNVVTTGGNIRFHKFDPIAEAPIGTEQFYIPTGATAVYDAELLSLVSGKIALVFRGIVSGVGANYLTIIDENLNEVVAPVRITAGNQCYLVIAVIQDGDWEVFYIVGNEEEKFLKG